MYGGGGRSKGVLVPSIPAVYIMYTMYLCVCLMRREQCAYGPRDSWQRRFYSQVWHVVPTTTYSSKAYIIQTRSLLV